MKFWLGFMLCWQLVLPSFANEATALAEDPVVEQRLISIAEDLRCLVCLATRPEWAETNRAGQVNRWCS